MTSEGCHKCLLKCLALLLTSTALVLGQLISSVDIKSYRQVYNKDFYKSNQLELINYANHRVFNGCVVFSRDIHEFEVTLETTVPKVNATAWTLLNITLDGCKILASDAKGSRKIISTILEDVKAYSARFPAKCPIKKDKEYCIRNFSSNAVRLPPYLPASRLNFFFGMQQKEISIFRGYFEVKILNKH